MFSYKLKELMELKDVSPADLSKATGISETTFSAWIKGRSGDPKLSTIDKLAKALEVSPEYFFDANFSDILSHLSKEEKKLVLSKEFSPWMKGIKQAMDNNISPDIFDAIIKLKQTLNK